jgi:pentatricopeptide repeat protein
VEEGYHPHRGDAEVEVEPDVRIYNGLIDIFSNYGPLADARRLFDKMRAQGMKPDISTWNALIRWHCRVVNMKCALRLVTAVRNLQYQQKDRAE